MSKKFIGKHNEIVVCTTTDIEYKALEQLEEIARQKAYKDYKIAVMADCHSGKGSVIGFTAMGGVGEIISPNMLGVDIGCGAFSVKLGKIDLNLEAIDNFIRGNIPKGDKVNKVISDSRYVEEIKRSVAKVCRMIGEMGDLGSDESRYQRHLLSLGTLGGGNHFIEIGEDSKGDKWITVHSGSRNFGHVIADYFQKLAIAYCEVMSKENDEYNVPNDLAFLENELKNDYLYCMRVATEYAHWNRIIIVRKILDFIGYPEITDCINSIHNYYEFVNEDMEEMPCLRKGAISAKKGELVVIPINMRDGIILARGLGNEEANFSAPHGAGRLMSRSEAKEKITLEDMKKDMEGIFSKSLKLSNVDEAPGAYKPMEEIIENTKDVIEIIDIIKPIYNFKG